MAWTCFLDEPSFLHPTLIWVWCLLCPIRAFLNWKGNSQLRDDAICSFFLMGLFYIHPVSKFKTVAFISITKKKNTQQNSDNTLWRLQTWFYLQWGYMNSGGSLMGSRGPKVTTEHPKAQYKLWRYSFIFFLFCSTSCILIWRQPRYYTSP